MLILFFLYLGYIALGLGRAGARRGRAASRRSSAWSARSTCRSSIIRCCGGARSTRARASASPADRRIAQRTAVAAAADDDRLHRLVRGGRADADARRAGADQGRGAAAPGGGGMNPWPFVIAAYALTSSATAALVLCVAGWRCAAPKPRPTRSSGDEAQEPAAGAGQPRARRAARPRCCWRCGGCKDRAAYFFTPADIAARQGRAGPGDPPRRDGREGLGRRAARRRDDPFHRHRRQGQHAGRAIRGIVPDLFREGSGVVAEGRMQRRGTFVADTILAKHDERYMPPSSATSRRAQGRQDARRDDRRGRPRRAVAGGGAGGAPAVRCRSALAATQAARARAIRAVAVVQGALTLVAFAALMLVFARTDLSVAAGRRKQPQRQAVDLQGRRRRGGITKARCCCG